MKNIAMLKYKADVKTIAVVTLYFAMAILPWLHRNTLLPWHIAIFVAINCFLSFTCAVIVHNTIHVPIFKTPFLNKVFQVILSITYGHPVSAYLPGHNLSHHRYMQTPKDAIRTSKARFSFNILNQLLFFYIMSGDIISAEIRYVKKMLVHNRTWFWQYMFELIVVVGIKIALLLVDWKWCLYFVFIPHHYAAWGIVGTNYFQHDGCDETHPYNHSRNFTGKLFNNIMFNNGYHGAHHANPGLHWSLSPQFHQENIQPFIHPSLNRTSLVAYLWQVHIYPGKRIDYLGNPVSLADPVADEDWVSLA